MYYSDFTNLEQLQDSLGLQYKQILFFKEGIPETQTPILLLDAIENAKKLPVYFSEKARSELLITPVLMEVWKKNPNIMFFSGFTFDVDKSKGLNGACDYIINKSTNALSLDAPIICLVEAKNREIVEGLAQCAAEMYAAFLFNQKKQKGIEFVYGCISNGFDWQFLRLEKNVIYIDTQRYFLNEIGKILGIFDWIIKQYE